MNHAYSTTPYYRNLLDSSGIRPQDIHTLSDLSKIPISTKENLLSVPLEDRLAKGTDIGSCRKKNSSGTTGTPWDVLISPPEWLRRDLKALRAMLVNGYSLFHTTCRIVEPGWFPEPSYWFQHMGILRLRFLSEVEGLDRKVAVLAEGSYDVVFGMSSDLCAVAETILEKGIAIKTPKVVVTCGELMDPAWRRTIRKAFRRDPVDLYGSVEVGSIAWQCRERQGYHVDADQHVLELVNKGIPVGPGEEGEVIVTDLAPRAMPLIRFATGDWSSAPGAACPCGITLPILSHIGGRERDFLLLPSGRKIAPLYVSGQLKHIPGIKDFQVIQVSTSKIVVRFSRHSGTDDPSPAIIQAIQSVLGESMDIRLEELASIPRAGRKFRLVENAVLRAQQPT